MAEPRPIASSAGVVVPLRVLQQVQEAGVAPMDAWHLTATLEMEGWNDKTAQELGYPDLFTLARSTYGYVSHAMCTPILVPNSKPAPTQGSPIGRFIMLWLRFLPILFGVVAVIWAGPARMLDLMTAGYALCTWLSLLVSSGFVQALAGRIRPLLESGEAALAMRLAIQLLAIGGRTTLLLGLLLLWLTGTGPALFFVLLSALWLTGGLLRALQWEAAFLAMSGIAVGLLCLGINLTGLLMALGSMVAVGLGYALLYLHRLAQTRRRNAIPPGVLTWRASLSPFLLGLTLLACLLGDRVIVWSVGLATGSREVSAAYELGMLLASMAFLVPSTVAESGLQHLADMIYRGPVNTPAQAHTTWQRQLSQCWLLLQMTVMFSGLVSLWCLPLLLRWLSHTWHLDLLAHEVTTLTFSWGLGGYLFLAAGLVNVSLLTTLNQSGKAIGILGTAAGMGLLAMLFFGYPETAIGFSAGAATLWVMGLWTAGWALNRSGYLLYRNT